MTTINNNPNYDKVIHNNNPNYNKVIHNNNKQ